jgi:hypothetical protein
MALARKYSDAILAEIGNWEDAESAGKRAVAGHCRIPGAPHPPAAAWNIAVASGIARMLEPGLRRDLGYFYSEFVGVHDNYDRYNQFTEREVLGKEPLRARPVLRTRRPSATGFSRPHGLAKRICRRPAEAKRYGARSSLPT